ncbi:hypothetical protein FHW12_004240 [Dokdonella fugitiva]|uniref:Uncharacterized protein n=1 Tax=Dokdonella fugitiva TaxID=328517 RepID=A0A839F4K1_9GAMM|nr:hypothetical protein [Dokdonella fugitiva]MBA8889993.1 hypothetical protein [Dokdonella fugitiva]
MTVYVALDFVILPARKQDGVQHEASLWLALRPLILLPAPDKDISKHLEGWRRYCATLDGSNSLTAVFWDSECTDGHWSDDQQDRPFHVNLPDAWNVYVRVKHKDDQRTLVDASVLRSQRLMVGDWGAFEVQNNPRPAGTKHDEAAQAKGQKKTEWSASKLVGKPLAAAYNATIIKALDPPDGGENASDANSRIRRTIEQTDVALSLGVRRYANAKMLHDVSDSNLMVLRQAHGMVETCLHSLLGLTVCLARGDAAIKALDGAGRIELRFSTSTDANAAWGSPASDDVAVDQCFKGQLDTTDCSQPAHIEKLLAGIHAVATDPASLPALWDDAVYDDGSAAAGPLSPISLRKALLTQPIGYQLQVMASRAPGAPKLRETYLGLSDGKIHAEYWLRGVEGVRWIGPRAAAEHVKVAITAHRYHTFKVLPFRNFSDASKKDRCYRLATPDDGVLDMLVAALKAPIPLDAVKEKIESAAPVAVGASALQNAAPTLRQVSDARNGTIEFGSGADAFTLMIVGTTSGPSAFPKGLYLRSLMSDVPESVLLVLPAEADTLTLLAPPASTAPDTHQDQQIVPRNLAGLTAARDTRFLLRVVPEDEAAMKAVKDNMFLFFRNTYEYSLAQSLGASCFRVRIDYQLDDHAYACAATLQQEREREEHLGDRLSYVALNVYEHRESEIPLPRGVPSDPVTDEALLWRNPHAELYPWQRGAPSNPISASDSPANDGDRCVTAASTAASPFSTWYFGQVREAVALGPEDMDRLEETTMQSSVANFFRDVYARANAGPRAITFRAENTFGIERDLVFSRSGADCSTSSVDTVFPSYADWPIAHPAASGTFLEADNNTFRPAPLLSVTIDAANKLQLVVDPWVLQGQKLKPAKNGSPAEHAFSAFVQAWQAIAELASAKEAAFTISKLRYDARYFVVDEVGNDPSRKSAFIRESVTCIAKGLVDWCIQMLKHPDAVSKPQTFEFERSDGSALPSFVDAHAVEVTLNLSRRAEAAPLDSDWIPVRTMEGSDRFAALPHDASNEAKPVTTDVEAFLESRRSSELPVRRRRDDEKSEAQRKEFIRALGITGNDEFAGRAAEWLIPSGVAKANEGLIDVVILPLAFRSPIALARRLDGGSLCKNDSASRDMRLGRMPYEPILKLVEGLDALTTGNCPIEGRLIEHFAAIQECSEGIVTLGKALSRLIWPVHALPDKSFLTEAPTRLASLLEQWTDSAQSTTERRWIERWCENRLSESPRFFLDTDMLLYVELGNGSSKQGTGNTLPADFGRLTLDVKCADGRSRSFVVSAGDLHNLTGQTDGPVSALIPISAKDVGDSFTLKGVKIERIECTINRFAAIATHKPPTCSQEAPHSISAPVSKSGVLVDGSESKFRMPARKPAGDAKVVLGNTSDPASGGGPAAFNTKYDKVGRYAHHADTTAIDLLASKKTAGPATLTRFGSDGMQSPHAVRVDQYISRYLVEWEGDLHSGIRSDDIVLELQDRPASVLLDDSHARHDTEESIVNRLLKMKDPSTTPGLAGLILDGVMNCSVEAGKSGLPALAEGPLNACALATSDLPDEESRMRVVLAHERTVWHPANAGDFKVYYDPSRIVGLICYERPGANLSDAPTFYLAVDVLSSRWQDVVLAAQVQRNSDHAGGSSAWPFSREFFTTSQVCSAPFVAPPSPEIGPPQRQTVPAIADSRLDSLLKALAPVTNGEGAEPAPHLSALEPALWGGGSGWVRMTFYHRQYLSALQIADDGTWARQTTLTESSHVPLATCIVALPAPMATALQPLQALLAEKQIRNFAVDVDWRTHDERSRMRWSKWAFDAPSGGHT